jgi:peptidoglycan/xylan/chitin deacetylase (PgdA/CDA1 family)
MFSSSIQTSYSTGQITKPPLPPSPSPLAAIQSTNCSTKLIVLAFDDSSKTEFNLAKPVLDKYGYKGNFFTVCSFSCQFLSQVHWFKHS